MVSADFNGLCVTRWLAETGSFQDNITPLGLPKLAHVLAIGICLPTLISSALPVFFWKTFASKSRTCRKTTHCRYLGPYFFPKGRPQKF